MHVHVRLDGRMVGGASNTCVLLLSLGLRLALCASV